MSRREFRLGGFGLAIEVPDRVAGAVKRLRRAPDAPAHESPELDAFEVRLVRPPELRLHKRDAAAAVSYIQLPEGAGWLPPPKPAPEADPALFEEVSRIPWYHCIELPGGLVTPGEFDHRELLPHYGIDADMSGKRVLDVGTFDGFWAFEFERRGAEVVALDADVASKYDFPTAARQLIEAEGIDRRLGDGFRVAHRALGSSVKRVEHRIYDIDPGILGMFDVVHMGDVLLHLERPLDALLALRSVTRGKLILADVYLPELDGDPNHQLVEYRGGWNISMWWLPSLNSLAQMVLDSGFSDVRVQTAYKLARHVPGHGFHHAVLVATP